MTIQNNIEAALTHGIDITGRRIFLHGDVEEDSIGVAIRGMYMLADSSRDAIELYVTSYGGDLDEAFSLHDVTRTVPCPIHTIALGKCMSAAPLLVACGARGYRYATEHCTFMLHDASISLADGSPAQVKTYVDLTASIMDRYAVLLGRYTKKDKRFWTRIFASKVDRFFTAEQAVDWGVVDQVWAEKP